MKINNHRSWYGAAAFTTSASDNKSTQQMKQKPQELKSTEPKHLSL